MTAWRAWGRFHAGTRALQAETLQPPGVSEWNTRFSLKRLGRAARRNDAESRLARALPEKETR